MSAEKSDGANCVESLFYRILGNKCLLLEQDLKVPTLCNSRDLRDLVFTGPGSRTYVHSNHLIRSAQGLRKRRSSKTQESDSLPSSHGNDSSPGDSPNEADSAIDRVTTVVDFSFIMITIMT